MRYEERKGLMSDQKILLIKSFTKNAAVSLYKITV